MTPPKIWHGERIPDDARVAMGAAWDRLWFAKRSVRVCVLEDAYVAAEGLVITEGLEVIEETVQQHSPADVVAACEAIRAGEVGPRLSGTVLLCRKPGTRNYGHWLVEMLPRVWVACQAWPGPLGVMVQAVDEPLRSVMRDSLACLGIGEERCHAFGPAPVLVERLVLVEGLTEHGGYMSPLVFDCLDRIGARIGARGAERLLISRGEGCSRRFVDEGAVWALGRSGGFEVFSPGSAGFVGQVAAFGAARGVVGAAGAGMANLVFCRPGSRAFILTPAAMRDTFFWFIGGLRGLDVVDVRCLPRGPRVGPMVWDTEIEFEGADFEAMVVALGLSERVNLPEAKALHERLEALFDARYYLGLYPDVAAAGVDPLSHYMEHGWREGRSPCPAFERRLDREAAACNPLMQAVFASVC